MESLAYIVAALDYEEKQGDVQPARRVKTGFSLQSALYCFMAALVVIVGGLSVAGTAVSVSAPQPIIVSPDQR